MESSAAASSHGNIHYAANAAGERDQQEIAKSGMPIATGSFALRADEQPDQQSAGQRFHRHRKSELRGQGRYRAVQPPSITTSVPVM